MLRAYPAIKHVLISMLGQCCAVWTLVSATLPLSRLSNTRRMSYISKLSSLHVLVLDWVWLHYIYTPGKKLTTYSAFLRNQGKREIFISRRNTAK